MTGATTPTPALEPLPRLHVGAAQVQRLAHLMGLVQATALEVGDVVDAALRDNPMVQRAPGGPCRACGRHCATGLCAACARLRLPDGGPAARVGWREELAAAARAELPAELAPLAEAVVGSLDDDGLLPGLPACPSGALARVLDALRAVGPPGIAARTRTECVVAQAHALVAAGRAPTLLADLVDHHRAALAAGDLDGAAAALGVGRDDVVRAVGLLRSCTAPAVVVDEERPRPATPDVVYAVEPGTVRLVARVPDAGWFGLCLDDALWSQADREGRAWLRPYRREATGLLRALDARGAILQSVATVVGEVQRGFLLEGPRAHRPLSRAEVAATLGLHPTTVVRAVAGKVVRCPDGRLVPFADCFGAATAVVDALRALLEVEPRASDARLAGLLAAQGHDVARRTVTKYRHRLSGPRRTAPRTPLR